jgi:signal transduction histidine kinase/ActR/RegA family two-component response regulator
MTKYRRTLYATSTGGAVLSFVAFFAIRQQESTNFVKDFKVECENRVASIHREVESDLSGLSALRAFVHTTPLDQAKFVGFAGEILRVHSSIRALEWVPKVSAEERRSFEHRLDSPNGITEGSPAHPYPAGSRDEFFPVQYLYPRAGNDNAIGFNLGVGNVTRRPLERARDTGAIAATEKLPLLERTADGYGVIAFAPVYSGLPEPATTEQRRARLQGFAMVIIQVADVVERGLSRIGRRGLDIYFFDRSSPEDRQALYYHRSRTGDGRGPVQQFAKIPATPIQYRSTLPVAGREWLLAFVPTDQYLALEHSWHAWGILIFGLLTTTVLTAYLRVHSDRATRTQALVTELEALNQQLATARDEALEASILKTQFLANISHEIRTPMNGLLGMTELVLASHLTPEQRELLQMGHASGQKLQQLLNSILDLSRSETGKLIIESISFDLREELEPVVRIFREQTHRRGVSLHLYWDERLPRRVSGDPMRLRQVFTNLLSNAAKFTEKGSIRVSAAVSTGDESTITAVFEVRDTGIGIPPGVLGRLFVPFTQADGSTTRKYGGSGLGLAISKQLVSLMGGTISAESEFGKGSVFTFTVPLRADEERAKDAPLPAKEVEATPVATVMRVLVAEDNDVSQLLAKRLLERLGCTVDTARTGLEAIELWRQHQYQLILMDCQMPELDGYEATKRIRIQQNGGPGVPVIALTAHASAADHERCIQAGMDDYIAKPVSLKSLSETLVRWMPLNVSGASAGNGS